MKKCYLSAMLMLTMFAFAQENLSNKIKINYGTLLRDCRLPTGKTFSINYLQRNPKINVRDTVMIKVRLPASSTEVFEFNNGRNNPNKLHVNCFPFIKGAKVTSLELVDFVLEKGSMQSFKDIQILTNVPQPKTNNPGGKEFCIQLKGAIEDPGTYNFIINLKVKVSVLGIPVPSSIKCSVEKGYITAVK